ncbi:MAG: hypothetical protein Q4D71_11825 [Oscillospiraceae bacterium]|nr:hypothetical protein [Oscillospiraceae bacterium]
MMTHSVQVNVTGDTGQKEPILRSRHRKLPQRLLRWMFGAQTNVLVLMPGRTVDSVLIRETGKEGKHINNE